jgi:hypothetical protein
MQRFLTSEESIFGLIRDLRQETVDLIRQEVKLAKTEMSENIAKMGRNVIVLLAGGFVAYAGVIALLIGLGFLISMLMVKLGLDRALADFAGLGIIGLIISMGGTAFVLKGVKGFSAEKLKPQKTVETIQEIGGASTLARAQFGPQDNRDSDQIQAHVETTREQMRDTVAEIRHRLTPGYMRHRIASEARSHPAVTAAVGVGTGLLGMLMLRRRRRNRC